MREFFKGRGRNLGIRLLTIALSTLLFSMSGRFGLASVSAEEISVDTLIQSVRRNAAGLENCHIVFARREKPLASDNSTEISQIQFGDLWTTATAMQARFANGSSKKDGNWWTGFKGEPTPVKTDSLHSFPDQSIVCARAHGDIVWAQFAIVPKGKLALFPSIYSTSQVKRPVLLFLPLLDVNREWSPTAIGTGASPIINSLMEIPEDKWRLLDHGKPDDQGLIRVEVPISNPVSFRLKRHESTLEFAPVYVCYFNSRDIRQLARIHSSVRYRYLNVEYPYERPAGKPYLRNYEASDFQTIDDNVVVPMSGLQKGYEGVPGESAPFDADVVVDRLLAFGKFVDDDSYRITSQKEWRIISVEKTPSDLDLWFDPPPGTSIRLIETPAVQK